MSMWKVQMSFDMGGIWYDYGSYYDHNRANEIAMQVEKERDCWVRVIPI